MQYDAKIAKKLREMDTTVVQTLEMEKKLHSILSTNKMVNAEVAGTRLETERLGVELEQLRRDLKDANESFERECAEVERLTQLLHNYRKQVNAEARQREQVQ